MWTMVLADDEPIIVHGLQQIVQWEQLGIRVVGTATDGDSALALILHHKPDLAILDINMPGRTGLQLVEGIRDAKLETRIIFISGYRQFDYALGAMRLGAVNFLLKPIDKNELLDSVRSCLPIPDEIPEIHLEELPPIPETDARLSTFVPVLYKLLEDRPLRAVERRLQCFAVANEIEAWRQQTGVEMAIYQNGEPICLLFKEMDSDEVRQKLLELSRRLREVTQNQIGFLVGMQAADATEVPKVVARLYQAQGEFYFYSWRKDTVCCVESLPRVDDAAEKALHLARQTLLENVLELDAARFSRDYQQYCDTVCRAGGGNIQATQMRLLSLCQTVLHQLSAYGDSEIMGKAEREKLVEHLSSAPDFVGAAQIARTFLTEIVRITRERFSGSEKTEALRAMRYIEEYYAKDLTLEKMASYVHMNASYFSSYFKKQTGKNFKEYLTTVRLQNALRLLISTDKKNYEIADEVGFSDAKAFTQQFQKMYGKTPQAYRREMK